MRSNAQCPAAVGTQELVCSWISITVSFLGTEGVESWKSSPFHLSSLPQCLPTALSRVRVDGGTVHLIAETRRGPGSNRKQYGGNVRTFPGPRFSPRVQVSTQHLPGVLSTAAPSSPFPPLPQHQTRVSPQSVSKRFLHTTTAKCFQMWHRRYKSLCKTLA